MKSVLREEALRRALQFARDRRADELEGVQERSRALRRRLRELTDRGLALGTVNARFVPEAPPGTEPAADLPLAETHAPAVAPAAHPPSPAAPTVPASLLLPPKEESHDALLAALAERHPDGFTVSQMKAIMEELDSRAHSYDAAWALANRLERGKSLEVAGSRPGPTGPIRVLRVPRARLAAPEVR